MSLEWDLEFIKAKLDMTSMLSGEDFLALTKKEGRFLLSEITRLEAENKKMKEILGEDKMRKCTAGSWQKARPPEKIGKWVDVLGVFHQFGVGFEEFGNTAVNYTFAIVEDIEGQVWECETTSLKFLE